VLESALWIVASSHRGMSSSEAESMLGDEVLVRLLHAIEVAGKELMPW
jgi:hypothetical protein